MWQKIALYFLQAVIEKVITDREKKKQADG